jgi:hypothetical protein
VQSVPRAARAPLIAYYFRRDRHDRPRHAFVGDAPTSLCREVDRELVGLFADRSPYDRDDTPALIAAPRRTCRHCLRALSRLAANTGSAG